MSALPDRTFPPSMRTGAGPRLAADRLSCRVARSLDEVRSMREEWDACVADVGAGITQSYDWCRIWWDHYGAGREARLFLFSDGGAVVGVLPMCLDRLRLGPVSLNLARPIGSDFMPGVWNPAVRTTWASAAFDIVLQQLARDDRCDAILLPSVTEASGRIAPLRAAVSECSRLLTVIRDRPSAPHVTIDLPETFDAYLRRLSRKQRYHLKSAEKRLRDRGPIDEAVITDPEQTPGEFDAFIDMHDQQWARSGKLGHFRDWPGAAAFNGDLVSEMSKTGRVRLLNLRVGDQIVARQYGFVHGDQFHWRLPAREITPDLEKLGLGRRALIMLCRQMIFEGVRRIDAGIGHYGYKLRLGGTEHQTRTILLAANRPGTRVRARVMALLADAIDNLYFKLWFRRLAPHVPRCRSPLWNTWIRTRL